VIGPLLALFVAPPTVVLVTGPAPGPDSARIEAARAELGKRFRIVDAPREVLEGYTMPPAPDELVRDALERAHQGMRRFELAAVRQALAEAREAAARLAPTDAGRQLAAVVALREAELAMVVHDRAGQRRAVAFVLSIDPALTPDPQRVPPPLVQLIEDVRRTLAKSARVRLRVETTPPAARIVVGDRVAGRAPTDIESGPGPLVVWATRDGSTPRALWTEAHEDQTISIELEPLDQAARLRPLVSALRQAGAQGRRAAALALAAALGVDSVAMLDGDARAPTIYGRQIMATPAPEPAPSQLVRAGEPAAPPPVARAPLYRRAWFWAVVGGLAAASASAVAIYYFSQPDTLSYTCCR